MSTKMSQPVLGFNHNLKFGPRIYHVQTEDSGLPHAHYITHLFVGGNILASMKTSYAEKAEEPDLPKVVRSLMEGQHKAMVKRLVAGEFNEKVELFAPHYEPGVLASGQSGPEAVNAAPALPPEKPAPTLVSTRLQPVAPAAKPPPAPAARPPPPQGKPLPPPKVAPPFPPRPATAPPPPLQHANTPAGPSRLPGGPLPQTTRVPPGHRGPQPPPVVAPNPARIAAKATPHATEPSMPPVMPTARPAPAAQQPPPPLSRNPFAFEANPFASEQPVEAPNDGIPTLFAEELISVKSLDEVILAFLSADLEQSK